MRKAYEDSDVEISLIALRSRGGFRYKVTKRIPSLRVAETRVLSSLPEAEAQFQEWLRIAEPRLK
jgi:hypothetical protein